MAFMGDSISNNTQEIKEKIINEIVKNVLQNIDVNIISDDEIIEKEIIKLEDELKTINDLIYKVKYDNKTKSDIDNLNKSNEKVKIAIISRITYLKSCKYLNNCKQDLHGYIDTIVRAMYN